MCVICVSPSGVDLPDEEDFRKMFDKNDDGAGFMWPADGKVHIRKGYMDIDGFLQALDKFGMNKDTLVVTHFRIGTAGARDETMTHPFPLCDDEDTLKQLQWDGDIGICHNGSMGSGEDGLSDTALFVRDILYPIRDQLVEDENFHKGFKPLIETASSTDRILLLNKYGRVMSTGKWIKDDGLYFSNKLWEGTSTCRWYGGNQARRKTSRKTKKTSRKTKKTSRKTKKTSRKTKKTSRKTKKTSRKTKKKANQDDVICSAVAKRLMKSGLILQSESRSNSSTLVQSLYRWNDDAGKFETRLSGVKSGWRDPLTSIDSLRFQIPNCSSTLQELKEKVKEIDELLVDDVNPYRESIKDIPDDPEELADEYEEVERILEVFKDYEDRLVSYFKKGRSIMQKLSHVLQHIDSEEECLKDLTDCFEMRKDELQEVDTVSLTQNQYVELKDALRESKYGLSSVLEDKFDIDGDGSDIQARLDHDGFGRCRICHMWNDLGSNGLCSDCRFEDYRRSLS